MAADRTERVEYRVLDRHGSGEDARSLDEARLLLRSWEKHHPQDAPYRIERREVGPWSPVEKGENE